MRSLETVRSETQQEFRMICASCKRVRVDGTWVVIEPTAIKQSMGLKLSHGVCPECAKKLYGQFLKKDLA
jgi:hypothetical protein